MTISVNESLRLKRMASLAAGAQNVLDAGSAQSPNPYLQHPNITGIDLSHPRKIPDNYTDWVVGNALNLPFSNNTFDAVIAGELIEHTENPFEMLREFKRVLSKKGKLIVSTPNPNSPIERILTLTLSRRFFYTDEHLLLYPQRWLIRMLERTGFKNVKLYSGGFPLPFIGLIPFPRPWCHQTIAVGEAT